MSDTDLELLARYARQGAEDAFAGLVRRHVNLVYSTALRVVRSPHLAEEVAQTSFLKLARHADRLAPDTILTAWLYQVTRREAVDVVRREASRQRREQIATEMNATDMTVAEWTRIEPLLDEAMHTLDHADRAAVLLRYFENKSLREVGQALGASEDTAQKRVSRAVERLREFFLKRGIAVGASGLAATLSANSVQAAPLGLAATLTSASFAGAATGVTATLTVLNLMKLTKLKMSLAALVLAGVATILTRQQQSNHDLRQENEALRRQVARIGSDNAGLSNRVVQAGDAAAMRSDRLRELLRLRWEVGALRREQRERQQAGTVAQAKDAVSGSRPGAVSQTGRPAPFQIQLVMDEAGDDSEAVTNHTESAGGQVLNVRKSPLLDHTAISSVEVTTDPLSATPRIDLNLSETGKELFAQITRENINRRLALVLGGKLYSAPVIRAEIPDGKPQITGSFTEEEAKALAAQVMQAIQGK